MHKMFTLEDLYNFYSNQNKTCSFNSKESNCTIIVQIPEKMSFSDEYDPTYNLLPTHLMSCHLLENNNRSSISEKAMKEAIPSFYNRPILGYIQEIENDDGTITYDFAGHEMDIDENGDVEYKEAVIGVIPESCNPQLVYNEEYDKTYLEVDGLIYEDYTKAAEILRNKGQCNVSIEISVDSLSFDAGKKILNIDQFHFLGVTILGVTTDESHAPILPGMEGSNITISDFSAENNSFVFNKQDLIDEITAEVLNRLDYKSADDAEAKTTERRKSGEMDKENLTVEYDETEIEEAEVKPEAEEVEATEDKEETPVVETESSNDEIFEEETVEETKAPEVVEEFDDTPAEETEDETEEEHQSVSTIEDEDSTGTRVENSLNYSVTIDGVTKEFAVSLQDKINAITILVNDTYSESDNAFYDVEVFEDPSKFCVMHDWWNNRHFKQEYTVKKDVYSLKGDRIKVTMQFLTDDQIAQLDKMKADFAAIESELNSYKEKELHAQREAILASDDYSPMTDFAEFAELKSNMDNYSVDDLTKEADLLYAKFMKTNYSTFAAKESSTQKVVFMTSGENKAEEKLPYGGLFKNFKGKK